MVTDFSCHSRIQKMKELGEQAGEKALASNSLKVDKYYSLMLDSRLNSKTMNRNLLCSRGEKKGKDKKNQRI